MDDLYTSDYMRKLLIESPYIRARLENPGGSVILTGTAADTERADEYSPQIGSGFHLDLIEAETLLRELPTDQRDALLVWAAGVTAKQAAMYFSAKGTVLRKRRERGVESLTEKMNDESTRTADAGGRGGSDSKRARKEYRRIS